MGAWGHESCSNDECWDHLKADDIYKMTQEEADKSVKYTFDKSEDSQTRLGVVIWILRHGLKVDEEYLVRAGIFATELMKDEDHLSTWRNPDERAENLKKEIKDIQNAIENNGNGVKKHIPGLFEKMMVV